MNLGRLVGPAATWAALLGLDGIATWRAWWWLAVVVTIVLLATVVIWCADTVCDRIEDLRTADLEPDRYVGRR